MRRRALRVRSPRRLARMAPARSPMRWAFDAGASGLVDTATGQNVDPVAERRAMWKAARRPATTWCSRVDVDGSGNVTLDQQRAVVHPTNNPNEPKTLSAANLVTLTATITDKDGDSASAALEHRPEPGVPGRRPEHQCAGCEPTLTVDETVLATNATASFAGAFTSAFGADGAGTITYALGVQCRRDRVWSTRRPARAVILSLNGGPCGRPHGDQQRPGVHGLTWTAPAT